MDLIDLHLDRPIRARHSTAATACAATGPWNEVIASLLDHRSVRGFLPDALPPGTPET